MKVEEIIKNLCFQKTKCLVKIEGIDESFETHFIGCNFNPPQKYIEIRSLSPLHGNISLKNIKKIRCEFIINTLSMAFFSEHIKNVDNTSYMTHYITIPDEIFSNQKRKFIRVFPTPDNPINCDIYVMDKRNNEMRKLERAKVVDISTGGILVELFGANVSWEPEQKLPKIQIFFPKINKEIVCSGIIKRISKIAALKGEAIGIELTNLPFDAEQNLSQYVAVKEASASQAKKQPDDSSQRIGKITRFK